MYPAFVVINAFIFYWKWKPQFKEKNKQISDLFIFNYFILLLIYGGCFLQPFSL